MCRHYGFRANEPTKVECTLVHAQNALLAQSRADLRGRNHTDGWGIAVYNQELPEVERRATAAYQDVHFNAIAARLYAKTVVAHVRKSTIGGPSLANTHPFVFNCWSMCHNGTVSGFHQLQESLIQETAAEFRSHRLGTTDSEQLFYWLLTRMQEAGISARVPCQDEISLTRVIAESLREIVRRCLAVSDHPPRLNIIMTDGDTMIATRWRHSLYWCYYNALEKCEHCGVPHVEHRPGIDYRAIVVASEPISRHEWYEFPNYSILSVGHDIVPIVHKIAAEPECNGPVLTPIEAECVGVHCLHDPVREPQSSSHSTQTQE